MHALARRGFSLFVIAAVAVALCVAPGKSAAAGAKPFLGTLITHSASAPAESKAGVKMAMLEVAWKYFEPQRKTVDKKYAGYIAGQYKQFRAAGMQVTLGLGLHFTPAWVLATPANRLKDQHGTVSSQADFVFNRNVRLAAVWYLQQLNKIVPLQNFWAVRVTSGGSSELLYPSSSYWAWSVGAQAGNNRPTSLQKNPYPGRSPASLTTAAQRRTWAHWYVGALADVADWQMSAVSALGFRGYYQVVTPGQGLRPKQWNALMTNGLPDGLLGRGAAWYVLFAHLRHRKNVTVYVSSVADGTADSSVCASGDTSIALTDPQAFYWSGARWLSRIARGYGMTVAGEPPGYPASTSGRAHYADRTANGLLATAMRQATACGFLGLYWAHDAQVRDGTMPLGELARYSSATAVPPANAPR